MLQQRKWIDRDAEIEFWQTMKRLEGSTQALEAKKGLWSMIGGGRLRRAGLLRDVETLRSLAEDLVRRYTVLADLAEPEPIVVDVPASASASDSGATALRTLASLAVSLRQDRDGPDGIAQETASP